MAGSVSIRDVEEGGHGPGRPVLSRTVTNTSLKTTPGKIPDDGYKEKSSSPAAAVCAGLYKAICVILCFVVAVPLVLLLIIIIILQAIRVTIAKLWLRIRGLGHLVGTPLDGGDAFWVTGVFGKIPNVCAIALVDGLLDIPKGAQDMNEMIVEARDAKGRKILPKLTQIVHEIAGQYVWVEYSKFSIHDQYNVYPEEVEDSEDGRTQLMEICSQLYSTPLPKELPEWRVTIILLKPPPGETNWKPKFYMCLRMNHAIADGVTALKVLMMTARNFMTAEEQNRMLQFIPSRPKVPWWKIVALLTQVFLMSPWFVMKAMTHDETNPLHGKPLSGDLLVNWSKPLRLSRIKAVKNLLGVSVNDVVTSLIAGAIRRHLLRDGDKTVELPPCMTAIIPVSVHLPEEKETAKTMRNNISLVALQLAIHEEDALSRLRAIRRRYQQLFHDPASFLFFLKYKELVNVIPAWLRRFMFSGSSATMAISNLPGPAIPIRAFGYTVFEPYFFIPTIGLQGLNMTVVSYIGKIYIGMSVDKAIIPDSKSVQQIFSYCDEELTELENILSIRPITENE